MADIAQLEQSLDLSVQSQRGDYFFGSELRFDGGYGSYANSLPSVYNPRRQLILHYIDNHPQNNLWQGAKGRTTHKIAGTSAEITGKRRVGWYQDVIMFNSDYGGGIGQFTTKIMNDFFGRDIGAVAEIVGRGNPDSPLEREAVVGVNVLDPLRCHFTQNQEYPVWYQNSVDGKFHKMHRTRVHRFVDLPYPDPELRGLGFCALSRALGFVQQHIVQQTYIGQSLSNEMPPGILLIKGKPVPGRWKEVWDKYEAARRRDGLDVYKPIMVYLSSGEEIIVEFIPLSTAPAGFEPIAMTDLQARGIALALDIDPQDVLPLASNGLGQNGESKTLDTKNREGGFTFFLKMFERFFNDKVLPDPLRFRWKYRDSEQSKQAAEITSIHLGVAREIVALSSASGGALSSKKLGDIAIRYLADNVDSLAEILTDENGELISLYDDDSADETPTEVMVVSDVNADVAPLDPTTQTQTEEKNLKDRIHPAVYYGNPDFNTPPSWIDKSQHQLWLSRWADNRAKFEREGRADSPDELAQYVFFETASQFRKDFEDTRFRFTDSFAAVLIDANNGDIASRRRAGTILRSILAKEGRAAVFDGLAEGGVEVDVLEGDDLTQYNTWLAEQSGYVSSLTARIWDKGLSDKQIIASAETWANKSLQGAFYIGRVSADKNGMYKFGGRSGQESCDTCVRLYGQVHRMSEWVKRQLRPGVDTENFECGGWRCEHELNKTKDRARGRF